MAKLSSINKNEKRRALVKKYAGKYAKLKAIANDQSLDETERLIARLKMAEIPATAIRPVSATVARSPVARVRITASSVSLASCCVNWPTRARSPASPSRAGKDHLRWQ